MTHFASLRRSNHATVPLLAKARGGTDVVPITSTHRSRRYHRMSVPGRVPRIVRIAAIALMAAAVGSCDYVRLLRPSVLKQLNPRVVRLVDELPAVDQQNEAIVGRLFPHGGLAYADEGKDGVMHTKIHVPPNQFLWEPSVIVMKHGGDLELEFQNEDHNFHIAFLPSTGARQMVELPMHQGGRARIHLDQPGLYWFGCPVANHAGRGMLGLVLVKGDVPAEAKLDRPKQRRPGH